MSQNYCRLTGGDNQPLLIIGGGDVGVELTRRLADGWRVTLMDLDTRSARRMLEESGLLDGITFVDGDATSRLQLEKAGAADAEAVVVTTRPDDVGLEVARVLKRDFGTERLLVLLRQAETAPDFEALEIPYVHDYEAVAGSLVGRVTRGSRIAGDVGLGTGEILETEILPNSSVIGKPLALLSPQRWLVAAVYRNGDLVVPHGSTELQVGDRVLLVGDPKVLPCIARFLSTGHSEFPLPYGSGIGVVAPGEKDTVVKEVEYLLQATRAEFIEFFEESRELLDMDQVRALFIDKQTVMRQVPVERLGLGALAERVGTRDVGILVVPPPENRWLERVGLRRSAFLQRLNGFPVPTLVTRGSFPYRRIMLAVTDPEFDAETSIMAIDITRMLHATLTVAAVVPPDFVAGSRFSNALDGTVNRTVELAHSYGIAVDVLKLTGNPVRKVIEAARDFDLAVAGWSGQNRGSLLRPRVAQTLVHQAGCSVLVLAR